MQLINSVIQGYLSHSSMIRRMFEAGLELKKKYGADKVYDFSLGNPDLPPPPAVKKTLEKIAAKADQPFAIGYMPNAGYPALREKLALQIEKEQNFRGISAGDLILTCGAASAINVFFHAVLTPGDEVLTPAPYFVEYDFYVANHGGTLIKVPSKEFSFELDVEALAAAITSRTRAVILNSPNNPTGQIYGRAELAQLAGYVREAETRYGHPIYVIADEPYRFLNFDNVEIPCVFELFDYGIIMGSYSKNLSLPGERLGYVAVSPKIENRAELVAALTLCNRILGFVNAPAIGQQILLECLDSSVDLEIYRERRAAMAQILDRAGIEYTMPRGAFYFFPKSPCADEQKFVDALVNEHVLAVPGRGFGKPGYVRLAFCVSKEIILNAADGMARAAEACR